jgi:hypothetical protein
MNKTEGTVTSSCSSGSRHHFYSRQLVHLMLQLCVELSAVLLLTKCNTQRKPLLCFTHHKQHTDCMGLQVKFLEAKRTLLCITILIALSNHLALGSAV